MGIKRVWNGMEWESIVWKGDGGYGIGIKSMEWGWRVHVEVESMEWVWRNGAGFHRDVGM